MVSRNQQKKIDKALRRQQRILRERTGQRLPTLLGFGEWAPQPQRSPPPVAQNPASSSSLQPYLPPEMWNEVFTWLYPSELRVSAAVSKTWRELVQRHQVWRRICNKAHLGVRPGFLPKDVEWRPDHFALVQALAHELCESCYRRYRQHKKDRILPVAITVNDVATKIQMCRNCRVSFYSKHPEPIPKRLESFWWDNKKITPRIDGYTASNFFGLEYSRFRSLPFENALPARTAHCGPSDERVSRLYQEADILRIARHVYGGDIGITDFRSSSSFSCQTEWTYSDPQDDETKRRQILLRSLFYDKPVCHLPLDEICNAFVESGEGDPVKLVEEMDVMNWAQFCTVYDPTRPVYAFQDEERMTRILDDWLRERLCNGQYQSYKLDPASPQKPPQAVWSRIDKIDMGNMALCFAAKKVSYFVHSMMTEDSSEDVLLSMELVKEALETPQEGYVVGESPTLAMLLEKELGSEWYPLLVQEVKTLGENS
ncbi:hypothetical protein BGX33_009972 [Mortierella sp. NVP41]|nr:hypothetical protein BGX33_009972 [Mortierella sp. NVP41]